MQFTWTIPRHKPTSWRRRFAFLPKVMQEERENGQLISETFVWLQFYWWRVATVNQDRVCFERKATPGDEPYQYIKNLRHLDADL